ncbi:mannose-6-phosphate isomerase [Bosea caraganae]|uniref:Mannose-6-phosphate isomerase n=1 Tax=Bosea caraganae TaxID=2763117 RepID=A0A370LA60_9HYPH|nr:class I mannose-6-phosphate isomerase [Bosea caraganae]RDJ21887.1 mannose-6-phosphate isomerase [Bosea caraganae]RDJ28081.1 mannose-6-phosphate isomerase [Bosea caraganae]
MAHEHAAMLAVRKPWGSTDLAPWSGIAADGAAIGEIWFQRRAAGAPAPALLLKLLFTTQALSIQVHPDDAFAHSIGLANGKTEAWYILSAEPGAEVAIGLKRQLTAPELRSAIADGSIAELVQWHPVRKDEVVFVPAGTIHAIGPGLVIAEIQQSSDATFRLFDYGRQRELHIDNAVAVADAGPAERQVAAKRLTNARALLVASPYFVLERIELPAQSHWELHAEHETWLLVIAGDARVGQMNAFVGEAIYLDAEHAAIRAGRGGLTALVAYRATEPSHSLLHQRDGQELHSPLPHSSRQPDPQTATAGSRPRSTEARP